MYYFFDDLTKFFSSDIEFRLNKFHPFFISWNHCYVVSTIHSVEIAEI